MDLETLRSYSLSLPHATEEMPFGDDILVCKVAGKIFIIIWLGEGEPSISLKCDTDYAEELRDRYEGIQPGYHLNKRHWNSVYVDQLPDPLVTKLIRHSWNRVIAGLSRRRRTELQLEPLPE